MLVNQIISVDEDFDSGVVEEPVTLQEVKDYLRLGGFDSYNGEQGIDFDNVLLQSMINEGRLWLEKFTNQYIVPRSLTVVLLNQAGGKEIPGPVSGAITITDSDSVAFQTTDKNGSRYIKVTSGLFRRVMTPYGYCSRSTGGWQEGDQLTLTYEAGYAEFPAWVKNAILAYVAFAYENRGEEDLPGSPVRAAVIARAHRRPASWA